MSLFLLLLVSMSIILIQPYEWEDNNIIMKSTLKVHNPHVIILLICTTYEWEDNNNHNDNYYIDVLVILFNY